SRVPSPYSHFTLRRPHSFPTRRSSDLKEDLTLSILNIFVQIKRNSLRNTEIFHIRRYLETHLFTHSEEVVYSIFTGKNHCSMFRSEEHTSELQSRENLVCRLLLEKKRT